MTAAVFQLHAGDNCCRYYYRLHYITHDDRSDISPASVKPAGSEATLRLVKLNSERVRSGDPQRGQ